MRLAILAALSLSSLALAQVARRPVKQAVDALDDAASRARKANPQCRSSVYDLADSLSDRTDALKRNGTAREAGRIEQEISQLASTASWSNCPDRVVESLNRAADLLDDVRRAMWDDRRNDDDRPGDRRDDDDEQQWRLASMNPLQVTTNAVFENEPAVRVTVPELTLRSMRGQNFYLGAKFRSFQGNWSEWVTTQQWSVPSDPFVWRNAFTHFFRSSSLAEDDHADGRFIARVSLFDARGRELAFREVNFKVRLPRLPFGPPGVPPVIGPPPPTVQRDCGTGADVGCTLMRDGRFPMDGPTFSGFMRSLSGNTSEVMRSQTVGTLFANNYATAIQFGMILDVFNSEMFKMQAAQQGVGRVVNPQHAIGYADKFRSNLYRTQYTQLFANVPQQQPPVDPNFPPNPYRPPPPGPPQPVVRDCGTGPNDIGCGMSRNGRWPVDGAAWPGMYASLRGTMNEITRNQMLESMFGNQGVTAVQMGLLMDLFNNEITRLEVAKFLASRVVNPQHTLGFSTKFRNSILGQDFVDTMAQQH